MIRITQWRESYSRTNTRISKKKEIQKRRTMRVTVRGSSKKVNNWSKVVRNRKIITDFTGSISSPRVSQPVLLMDIKS